MRSVTRASRALFASLLVASGLFAGSVTPTLAQAGSGVGVEVPYVDDEGITRGTIELRDLADPFLEFEPSAPPEAGSRYVGLVVAFTAADDQQMEAYPYGVTLLDTAGTLWSPGYVARPLDATIPDAESQTMAPGNRLSGFIGFSLPEDVVIDQVLYQPDYYRSLVLADMAPGAGPAPGEVVGYTAEDGSSVAVTAEVTDPFTDTEGGSPPEAGTRYVMVRASFENTGDRRYPADPYALILHLADGHLVYSTSIPRPYDAPIPDLESQALSPGDHISGLIGFQIPVDAVIASVDYQPEYSKRLVVADLAGGGSAGPVRSPEPVASAIPTVSPAPAVTAAPGGTPAPSEPAASAGTAQ